MRSSPVFKAKLKYLTDTPLSDIVDALLTYTLWMNVEKLTPNQKRIAAFLKKNKHASYQEVADGIKLNKGSVQRGIKALQTKGKLVRYEYEATWVVKL
jgi:DNA-binding MarR family transcriptional regulator